MNSYLLDTNVVSELRKPRPHLGVVRWVQSLRSDQLFVSAVTLGEMQRGIERVRRQDTAKADEIERWVTQIEESVNLLPMDGPCFREWARLMEKRSEQLLEDAMIAATARVRGLHVATRNEKDFALFNVVTVNPFQLTS